jgi:RNA polymerase-binding transcription factor
MRAEDLQRYKKLLLEKQQELSFPNTEDAWLPQAGGREGDLMDQANADAEAELQIQLHQIEGRLSRAIEDALGRIRRGTYGVCTVCAQPISKPRLEAVPWAHVCRECKERQFA